MTEKIIIFSLINENMLNWLLWTFISAFLDNIISFLLQISALFFWKKIAQFILKILSKNILSDGNFF
jgi:hypothetical protein